MATDSDRTTPEPALYRTPVSIVGAWLTTISAFAFLTFLALEQFGLFDSPYVGLFGFTVIPAFFILGLLLIPVGMWLEGRRRQRGKAAWAWPAIDLNSASTRRVMMIVAGLTLVNISILAVAAVGVAEYSESNEFCGQTCHVPMQPEYDSHPFSPHAQIECVECHVAPGAGGAIAAKMNGTRQLYHYLMGSYNRPIPSARDRMPVPTETCQGCHDDVPTDKETVRTYVEYDTDEASSEWWVTKLTMYSGKIHWHVRPGNVVEYIATDDSLDVIPYIRATRDGETVEYFAEGVDEVPEGELRRMDCLDCHNRPAHQMTMPLEWLVDQAITRGEVETEALPFARREMVAALEEEYPDHEAAREGIAGALEAAWGTGPAADEAVALTQRLYTTNVFPAMDVTWGTYTNRLLHLDGEGGCFRCHDEVHSTRTGAAEETILLQDCELCHLEE